ncbi:CD225/dispanin family protein [Corynebacterium sp. 153RC1]|uniref:CD225/dispanin family protein n=1 Tax=unclassified Corynebacterium TaxID=2624378 RepID=UPI00211CCDC3|nr:MULTISPECIES: CD225/dispanin family protein [unclassified Corynebacterium]MCQ9370047.1 CD225/dispanin family protein [Corynebacterium sp. 35RC1]MCQ9351821.1 CD225/dispanin family protein [Corynebacterium sp. 209RC1]MCQ9354557.1 CD225/dispanin family protein [Corynebacterium sp. 1222RC1]MCQ9356103.1 CD225/dispanin family protein [Corynebacterium sp. 122RC1]MCQ9358735.1 CD225/dispanin family protein [Corynebacterium sp. 142RC1]
MTYPNDPFANQPGDPNQPNQPYNPQAPGSGAGFGFGGTRPETYLVWTILSTLLCCLPLGAVGIYYSTRVDRYWGEGRFAEAEDASKKAKNFAIWSAVAAVVVMVAYLGFMFFVGASGMLDDPTL